MIFTLRGGEHVVKKSDTQLEGKFRSLAEQVLGAEATSRLIEVCWNTHALEDIGTLPVLAAPRT